MRKGARTMGKKKSKSPKRNLVAAQKREFPLNKLRAEANFLNYIELLKKFAKKYCVMIVVSDTPIVPATPREITSALMGIGLRVDLYGKFRCAYAALIDAGQVVFEELRPDKVETKITVGESEIELVSSSGNTNDPRGLILINGKDCSLNMRGLNIIVFDKSQGKILDTTNFDTIMPTVPRIFTNMEVQALREFVEIHPDVPVICLRLPLFPTNPVTAGERFILKNKMYFPYCITHQDTLALNQYFDQAGVAEVLSTPKSYLDWNGVRRFEDRHGKHVNISGGHRETAYQPAQFQRTIFLLCNCHVFGVGSDDSRTIASYLQQQCNSDVPEARIIVQNYGFFLWGPEVNFEETTKILADLPVKSGDIVIYAPSISIPNSAEFPTINLTKAANRPRDYEVFFDLDHYTPDGYQLIAKELFKGLMDLGILQSSPKSIQGQNTVISDDLTGNDLRNTHDLANYLRLLKAYAQRYCVLVSFWDVSSMPGFTEKLSKLYREVGFQANLTEEPCCIYAALIDAGELVYEELCEDPAQYIDVTLTDEDFPFQANLVSRGPNSAQSEKRPIEINGNSYSSTRRGLHFVVYDKTGQTALDAVNFDISLDSVSCYHHPEGLQRDLPEKADVGTSTDIHLPAVKAAQKEFPFEAGTYKELAEYKKALTDWYNQVFSMTIGSVVMNCNPFTLGHRFLIETALTQCDFLIIFVVQEDKSRFPFEDRLRLVKEGVADLKNVAVFPSGRFVLSSLTFSEYFNKSKLQDRTIDTSLDVTLFARDIAPCLHITKRFAGKEPFDAVTRQYNETMHRILPEYGIEFVEIPRKTAVQGGEVIISASRVRDLLEKGDFDAIRPLVPESTFHYLEKLSGGVN